MISGVALDPCLFAKKSKKTLFYTEIKRKIVANQIQYRHPFP